MTGVGAAINTAKVTPGSSVVVFGCGGVGISAIQGARVAGASEIVAVDLVDSKLEDAQRFGATHAVKPDELDAAKATITGGDGFDYAFEAIGLPVTMRGRLRRHPPGRHHLHHRRRRRRPDGRRSAPSSCSSPRRRSWARYYGSADVRSDFHRLLRLWKHGRLDLEGMISKRITIDDVNDAVADLKAGTVIRSVITF